MTEPFAPTAPVFAPAIDEAPQQATRFTFSGTGSEYFRIWIVNLLLTIVTLGIYSAWAKVRRTRYFYDSTNVAGSTFDYHANPVAILKGRLVAIAFIAAYNVAFEFSPLLGGVMLILLILVMPWLAWRSLQFKLYNSSYRGIRFGFGGSLGKVYMVFLVWPLLALFTLYLLAPFAHQRIKKFQHSESRFGTSKFSFDASVGRFYVAYLIAFSVFFAGMMVILLAMGALTGGMAALRAGGTAAIVPILIGFGVLYLWMFMIFPIFLTMIQNLIWNSTRLERHQFQSDMKWQKMAFIMVTNIIFILLTLGLFIPFAQIRSMRYRISSMSLVPNGSLDNYIADTQARTNATSEGMTDLLDFDLSL